MCGGWVGGLCDYRVSSLALAKSLTKSKKHSQGRMYIVIQKEDLKFQETIEN